MAESAEYGNQHAIARLDGRDQHRFDRRPGGAVDQKRPGIFGFEDPAIKRHGLVHIARELRVELAEQGRRHGPEHARIGVDRPRPHQQAGPWVDLAEEVGGVGG